MKICTKCHCEKPLSDFYSFRLGVQGRKAQCIECDLVQSKRRNIEKGYSARRYARFKAENPDCKVRDNTDPKHWWSWFSCANARRRAKAAGIDYQLTPIFLRSIAPDKCPVLGVVLAYAGGVTQNASPSIDRINPNRGYVPDNVQIISHLANRIKNNGTADQVMAVAVWMLSTTERAQKVA